MRYTLVSEMRQCIDEMEQRLGELSLALEALPLLAARVFTLPGVKKVMNNYRWRRSLSIPIAAPPHDGWRWNT